MQLLLHTFLQSFFRFLPNSLIYFMLYSIFFITIRKRMWNVLHYIIRAGAHVCAKNAGKVSRKTEKNSRKAWNCAREYGKRNGIFTRTKRNFLRFRYEKPTVPQRKTYGSHGENIRFAEGKHKNYGNITRFSTRGFLKNGFRKKKDSPSRKGIKKEFRWTPTFVNLKSNTMKNTVQKYLFYPE